MLCGQSSQGFSSGRCTIGLRMLTVNVNFNLCAGFFGTRIAGGDNDLALLAQGTFQATINIAEALGHMCTVWCHSGDIVEKRIDDVPWDIGSTVWLQWDADTGNVRVRMDDQDFGIVQTLPPLDGLSPVYPTFTVSLASGGGGDVFALL